MRQMTRLLVRAERIASACRRLEVQRVEHFGDVPHSPRKTCGAGSPRIVVREEQAILFEGTAATRRVHDVNVRTAAFERFDVAFGEFSSKIRVAGVDRDRAAASLSAWNHDAQTAAAKHPYRCAMHARERNLHNAARMKKRDTAGLRRLIALVARHEEFARDLRRQLRGSRDSEESGKCRQTSLLCEA